MQVRVLFRARISKGLVISFDQAYKNAYKLTSSHYENFPVISFFLPKHLRKHVAIVYQFARQADDIADEGDWKSEVRIQKLELYEQTLVKCLKGDFENDFWQALYNTIQQFNLTPKYFFDLLSAFRQDIIKPQYINFEELMDYCKRSANPIGRIILELFNIRDENSIKYSDAICMGLQLTNFYQDVSIDFHKKRIYIPLNEMEKFGVSLNQFELKQNNTNFEMLLKYQVERTKILFNDGYKLLPLLPGLMKRQIKMTILGGEKILQKIEQLNYDVLRKRPKLTFVDYCNIFLKALV